MKNKYYTPSIEEFYVGFEFEKIDDKGKWIKSIFANGECAEQYCYEDEGRVKHLDKTDIEELGFNKFKNLSFQKEEDILIFDREILNKEWLHLVYRVEYKYLEIESVEGTLFSGYIKNKSELKILLKQLGIWN